MHYLQHVPESFWAEPLLQMVVVCCLQPTTAGFDIGDVTLIGTLSMEVYMHYRRVAVLTGYVFAGIEGFKGSV